MKFHTTLTVALAVLAAAFAIDSARAEDIGQHPAVFAPRALPGVNPSTFIVGHPASPKQRAGHANFEHPAVLIALRHAEQNGIDPNTYLVQPPATVSWTVLPALDTPIAMK
jgi:hypothetical protein